MAGGCASTAGIAPKAPPRSAAQLGLDAAAPPRRRSHADWWHDFGDAQLDALIDQALAGSPNLQVARRPASRAPRPRPPPPRRGRPAAARRRARPRRASASPTTASYPPPLAGSIHDTGTLQLSGSWEIDFFGKQPRRARRRARQPSAPPQADAEAARVLLASNVARGYVQLARLTEQREVPQRTLAQRERDAAAWCASASRAGLDTRARAAPGRRRPARGAPADRGARRADRAGAPCARRADRRSRPTRSTALRRRALAALHAAGAAGRHAGRPARPPRRHRRRALARRGRRPATSPRAKAQFYPNVNLIAFVGLSSIGLDRLVDVGQPSSAASARRSACRSSTPAACAPTCAARPPTSTPRSRATTRRVLDAVRDVADQIGSRAVDRAPAGASSAMRRPRPKAPTTSPCSATAPASATT